MLLENKIFLQICLLALLLIDLYVKSLLLNHRPIKDDHSLILFFFTPSKRT